MSQNPERRRSRPASARPAWYHEDNVFPSRRRMDWAHRPIVDLALSTLAGRGGAILDLGCGNGALLEKIHRGNPAAVPYGVEIVKERVAHARRLLPRFEDHVVVGDLFGEHPLAGDRRRYALVLLALRRLAQGGPRKSARLKRWIRARSDRLLVYGYGTSLTEFGDFAGFARAMGIRLADPKRCARAGIAARY